MIATVADAKRWKHRDGAKKMKKVEKSCWQTQEDVITYQSCAGEAADSEALWQLNSETTLKDSKRSEIQGTDLKKQ